MSEHKKYSASKIHRIIRCPGSEDFIQYLINNNEIPKEEKSKVADDGTDMHKYQDNILNGKPIPDTLDAEQRSYLSDNQKWLYNLMYKQNLDMRSVESKVDLTGYGIEDCGGTADVILNSSNRTGLHIVDWKFGKGIPVFVEKNEQLMTYLLGAAKNITQLNAYKELWIHIAQPTFDYYGSYQCSIEEVLEFLETIKRALKSHEITPGQKQCFWCTGKVFCSEYHADVAKKAVKVFEINDLMKKNYFDFIKATKVLKLEPFFKKVFNSIKSALHGRTSEQLNALGLKRVIGRSNRTFVSEEAVIKYIYDNYENTEDLYETPKLRSPAQLEKKFKDLKKDEEFKKLTFKAVGKPVIVDINDARSEISGDAAEVFSNLRK